MTVSVGQQLGNYRLIQLLGRGNFAEVYLGEHLHLYTQAAIKVLHAQVVGDDVEGFLTEARTIARLRHPCIIRVLDFGVEGTTSFLVMDYAPYGSLRKLHPKGTLVPLASIVSYAKQVATALQYAHDQHLIHRDVKPENLLLGHYNQVLLSDFGLAILVQSSSNQQVQNTAGTLAYMAPEQIQAYPRPASDQYALGIIVYEWLCGDCPFYGSFAEIANKHAFVPPPPLCEKVPTLPLAVEHVVFKALAKDPKGRFANVQAFATALEEACLADSSGQTLLVLSSLPAKAESVSDTGKVRSGNLPTQLTPLLGREQEVAAICTLLRRPEVRLVTLTGVGGVGKTCLSLQVATDLLDVFADGICFVSLAPVSDPDLVVPTIAQVLGLKEGGDQSLLELLKVCLRDKHLLLLLDNFEYVVAAAPRLSELLMACLHLKILVTSRAVLHLRGEYEFTVPPLALPDLTHLPEREVLSQYAAVSLFLQRAQAAKPDFQMTPTNARAIAEICVRLDGLPLAIELAVARIKLLPPQALLTRLSQRLQVLTSGAQDAPERQQTLRNTIAWSYHLLDAQEQRLFRQLSVFVGGCTLEALEAMCATLGNGDRAGQVLDGVASLINKSLLQQTEQEGEESRLIMLETIREYGLEVLAANGEIEVTRQAYATYYLTLVEETKPEFGGSQQQAVGLEQLEREYDNLRAAMQWSLEQGEATHSMEMALRLGGALRQFWLVRGYWSEGQNFLQRALAESEGVTVSVRAKALNAAANLALKQCNYEQGEALAEKSLALYRKLGDTAGLALALSLLGVVIWLKGNYAAAHSLTEEALALFREIGDKENAAWSLFNIGIMVTEQGDYSRGRILFEETLRVQRALENKIGIAASLLRLAWVIFYSQGDPAIVRALLEEGLALFKEMGDKEKIADSLNVLGWVVLQQGEVAMARSLAEESRVLFREIGTRTGIAESLSLLAEVAAVQGEHVAARALYEESLAFCNQAGDNWDIAFDLEGLAGEVAALGELGWAARLWGAAEVLRATMGTPMPPVYRAAYQRAVDAARTQLGEQAFAAAWAEGRQMSPAQALATQGRETISTTIPTDQPPKPRAKSPPTYPNRLTAREVEVLRLVAQGMTNEQVAEQLVISPRTVDTHLTSIYSKIVVSSRSAATRYATEHHLV
jgi:predicted ATPase/DNA-binding CsgD family transcriptional regulator